MDSGIRPALPGREHKLNWSLMSGKLHQRDINILELAVITSAVTLRTPEHFPFLSTN
jgi:hypothetical protein